MVSDVCEHFDSQSKYVTSGTIFFFFLHTIRHVNANFMRYFFPNGGNAAKPRPRIKVATHLGNIRREWSQEPKSICIRGGQNLFSANGPINSDLLELLEPFAGNGHLK